MEKDDSKSLPLWKQVSIAMLALQFSLDSSVYITSVVPFFEEIHPGNSAHNLFVLQACGAAIQTAMSLVVGYIATAVNNIKWLLVFSFLVSAVGNFLYSCAGPGSLDSAGVAIGGRVLCGFSSTSAALAYSYIGSVTINRKQSIQGFNTFRSSSAIFMALGQVISIGASFSDFYVSGYHINDHNAPTFVASFVIFAATIGLVVILEDPKPKQKQNIGAVSPGPVNKRIMKVLKQWTQMGLPAYMVMGCQFIASFVMSILLYYFPIYYSLKVGWNTLAQSIVFIIILVSSVAVSIVLPTLINLVVRQQKGSTKNQVTNLFIVIGCFTMVGFAVLQAMWCVLKPNSSSSQAWGMAIGFCIGGSFAMIGYNTQASTLPALFKQTIRPDVMAAAMPVMGAITSLGKLLAPIIAGPIYNRSAADGGMGFALALILNAVAIGLICVFYRLVVRPQLEEKDV